MSNFYKSDLLFKNFFLFPTFDPFQVVIVENKLTSVFMHLLS